MTPDEYRSAVKGKTNGKALAAYEELSLEIPLTVARLVREGIALCRKEKVDFILAVGGGSVIDSVDPSIPGGACMPGAEQLRVVNWAGALSGKGHPVTLRLANGLYREMMPQDMIGYVLGRGAQLSRNMIFAKLS